MEQFRQFSWKGVTILAKMDEETEYLTSLPRRSRFVVIVLLSFCFISFVFLYASSSKPTVNSIDDLKKAWNMGQYNVHRLADQENKHKSPSDITHAQSSTYRFGPSSGLVVSKGATLRLVIEARDRAGKQTKRGGDMWYATLNSLKPKASTAGKVSDNDDGTYDVTFYAGWEGVARIDIILVHPKEACSFVEKKVWPTEDRVVWVGTFRVKDQSKEDHTETCVLRRNETNWAKKCEYWYPSEIGGTMLICGKPEDEERWTCDDLYALKSLDARIALAASELIEGKEYLFEGENVMQIVDEGPKHIQIEGATDQQVVPALLPPCQPGLQAPGNSEGYWLNDQWHSLRCQNFQWGVNDSKAQEASRCLRGKEVYFLGDTTARQWFEAFQESIGLKFFLRNDDAHYRFLRHHPSLNLSVLYQARPLLTTSSKVPFEEVQFEVDVLDSLKNPKCNYIIFLSLWSDTNWDRPSFTKRLNLTKEAIERLTVRCPEARVVVRSPHPVAHGTFETSAYADNILLFGIKDLMTETFRNTQASFLDVWDMSLAYPSPNKRDMPHEVTQQGVNLFMSYVCQSSTRSDT
ncbi:NXPE family member 4-like [Patiria miniata]|uniref:NXPE C-terminal domain-containing protein n=1 Tax=Patiria miniata TaxID=46514 RepID=A0A913ZGB9_PATMI|nr:NXPE family member 4-like [Patiria miniata]